jgi:L-ascorbate metabolism protein UlaG (beta-lactamase superfamily)
MKLTYLSHSCFLVETSSHRLLIDPFLTGNPLAKVKAADVECDFILISHGHEDHMGDAVAIAQRTDATVIANFEVAMTCANRGVKKIHPMNPGGAWNFPFGRVKLTIAHHSSSNATADGGFLYLGNPCGILITADGKTLYHAGDTALFLDMKLIGELNKIDVAMLPIGDNFTMGIDDAALAVEFLKAKLAIPMHFNTFDLIKVDANAFAEKVKAGGAHAKVLAAGESIEIV